MIVRTIDVRMTLCSFCEDREAVYARKVGNAQLIIAFGRQHPSREAATHRDGEDDEDQEPADGRHRLVEVGADWGLCLRTALSMSFATAVVDDETRTCSPPTTTGAGFAMRRSGVARWSNPSRIEAGAREAAGAHEAAKSAEVRRDFQHSHPDLDFCTSPTCRVLGWTGGCRRSRHRHGLLQQCRTGARSPGRPQRQSERNRLRPGSENASQEDQKRRCKKHQRWQTVDEGHHRGAQVSVPFILCFSDPRSQV